MSAIYTKCTNLPKLLYKTSNLILYKTHGMRNYCLIARKYKYNMQAVQRLQLNQFHISISLLKRRKTTEERKLDRIIEYAPKAKGEIIEVWKDITLKEIANLLNENLQYAKDIFLNQIKDPNMPINDLKLIQQALKRGGRRMRIVGKPKDDFAKIVNKDAFPRPPPDKSQLKPRPPVVTVMGHVDHGKTTLLDALRHSSVVEKEFGGITQHIGAFSVVLDSGARITFLDTPGHAAFTAMRARGANLTDIVVLVVAADDGVMEQTVESIKMARNARVPILVAINKIDSPKADIARTENMLVTVGIQVENLGGDTQSIPISALKRQNLDKLTEALVLQAELLEIGADPTGPVEAAVVESNIDQYRGKLSTIIVQRGTLKKGSILVAGTTFCKVRTLRDADGKQMEKASPGYPAEIDGWDEIPTPGDSVLEVESSKRAREVVKVRQEVLEKKKMEEDAKVIKEKMDEHNKEYKERLMYKRRMGRFKMKPDGPRLPQFINDDSTPSLNVIIKGDVDGSVEAILNTLDTYESDDCKLDLVHYGVGAVTPSDIEMAIPFNAVIYAFNVTIPPNVKELAEEAKIEIKPHNVIYKLVDDVKEEINSRLPQKEVEEILGEATVLQQFEITQGRKKIPVAGCRCTKGNLKKSAMYKLVRNGEIVHIGKLSSMRHLKNEVDVIKTDIECGLQLEDKNITFQNGDNLICFETKSVPQQTDWDPGF